MLKKLSYAALLAGALFASSPAAAGGHWHGGHVGHGWHGWHGGGWHGGWHGAGWHGGWGGHGGGCWRWWYGQWHWAC
ncbi:hypothetical protein [Methylocystis rosea]|jgi:hypothetical protein|uniref:hypothetical protein n=1 Tax=Methylocystis rosea TaxID=173366 RepID=UPI000367AEDB|nr:hypothetical protein [Methylocystis rosea]